MSLMLWPSYYDYHYHHMPTHTAQLRILLRHDRTIPHTINTNRWNHAAFHILSPILDDRAKKQLA